MEQKTKFRKFDLWNKSSFPNELDPKKIHHI